MKNSHRKYQSQSHGSSHRIGEREQLGARSQHISAAAWGKSSIIFCSTLGIVCWPTTASSASERPIHQRPRAMDQDLCSPMALKQFATTITKAHVLPFDRASVGSWYRYVLLPSAGSSCGVHGHRDLRQFNLMSATMIGRSCRCFAETVRANTGRPIYSISAVYHVVEVNDGQVFCFIWQQLVN